MAAYMKILDADEAYDDVFDDGDDGEKEILRGPGLPNLLHLHFNQPIVKRWDQRGHWLASYSV